ncbi:Double-strand break repair protein MRE11 [Atta colombica]|uniref:Double-strand break repair protein n=1 Tax=Atta colombica TaxID=520822 RepID=A0A151I431_9HYME|nr:PREDICTED: double-strand break repair protein MRE11A [Atta colombica]KYM84030.1 Double-strand break repair protein MRE11 [Atta colombica]
MSESANTHVDPQDTINILVATDIHLGFDYSKKRGGQSDESFVTFEEILKYGKDNEVDMVLLGGDLFHETKPSQTALLKCIELLRKYCLGTKKCEIEFLSDSEQIFRHCAQKRVNYEDPNLNISMPVFTIHGNHDDPSFGTVGSIDILSATGLVNYFGKWTDLKRIVISPLILKKRNTHVALYGLSYINDQRLWRLYRDDKVELIRPDMDLETFNIFVLHQNRVKVRDAYISEDKLHKFLNLIIWGHEHECRIKPEFNQQGEYFISQPGSSIVTSLCESESKPKHVGLLKINKSNFKIKPLKLQSVRPFIFDNLILHDHDIKMRNCVSLANAISQYVDQYIENNIMPKVAEQLTGYPGQPLQPLIRLRIFYDDVNEQFDTLSLAQRYCDEVANPMDMILFRKRKTGDKGKRIIEDEIDDPDDITELFEGDKGENWTSTVQGGIKKYFDMEENKDKLTVLTVAAMNEALNRYIEKSDLDAFRSIVRNQMKRTIEYLKAQDVETPEDIREEIKIFRNKKLSEEQEEQNNISELLNKSPQKSLRDLKQSRLQISSINVSNSDDSDEELNLTLNKTKGKGRGSRGGRGSRSPRGSRGRGKSNETNASILKMLSSRSAQSKKIDHIIISDSD